MFHATVALRSVLQIQPGLLRQYGIRGLMLDLDNTLTTHDNPAPAEGVLSWIGLMRQAGIAMMIVSNNRSGRRVTDFCAELGIPYQGHAKKPGTEGLRKAMARAGKGRSETAMLGDKLLTDVLAANLSGVTALMVEPVGGAVTPWQKVLHAMQAPFKKLAREKEQYK